MLGTDPSWLLSAGKPEKHLRTGEQLLNVSSKEAAKSLLSTAKPRAGEASVRSEDISTDVMAAKDLSPEDRASRYLGCRAFSTIFRHLNAGGYSLIACAAWCPYMDLIRGVDLFSWDTASRQGWLDAEL